MSVALMAAFEGLWMALAAAGVVTLGAGFIGLRWFFAPVAYAKRIEADFDVNQEERTFIDPNNPSAVARIRDFPSITDAATCSLSVIVPAYNEQDRILVMLNDTISYLDDRRAKDKSFTYEIIVVDDCSRDRTVEIVMEQVQKHSIHKLKVLCLKENHGKGGAVRKGVLCASGQNILFADADGATDIRELEKLETALTEGGAESQAKGVIVCGSRAHLEKEAIAHRNPIRNFLMHGFHMIVATLCVNQVRDTQCGFKLFNRQAAQLLFPPLHIERWAFDIELLFVAAVHQMIVKEVSVKWHEIPGSKLNMASAILTMFREIVLIRFCYTVGIWSVEDGGFRLRKTSPSKSQG